MSFPTHLRLRSMLPLGAIVGGLMFLMSAGPAFAFPNITISLTNAPGYCLNRQGGGNSTGTTVFLYACSGGNNHWYEVPFNDPSSLCADTACITFEDYWNTNECFGLGNNNTGTLGPCDSEQQWWIAENGNLLRNVDHAEFLFTPNDSNGSTLSGYPTPVDWHQWTGE